MQRGGCPIVLTGRERWRSMMLLTENRLGVASKRVAKIQNESYKNVSDTIVKRVVRWEGLAARLQQKKPLLIRKHVLARLRFARRYMQIGPFMIGNALFSVMRQRQTGLIPMVGHGVGLQMVNMSNRNISNKQSNMVMDMS